MCGERSPALPDGGAELSRLLGAFRVDSLGDGDSVAGINQLASMAIALADLARPGSGIVTPQQRRLKIGCSILAAGPGTASGILDEVLPPVRKCQDNLLAQLNRLIKNDKEEESRTNGRRWVLNVNPRPCAGETALFDITTGDPELGPLFGTRADQWVEVVAAYPTEGMADLASRSRVFIAAATPRLLEQQLPEAHLGSPLVAASLNHAPDASKFATLCPALMDGLIPAGPSGETVTGRLIVTDARGLLREVATSGDDKTAWLGRLLWLVEGGAGPVPPPECDSAVGIANLVPRFELAVQRAFAGRLDNHKPAPVLYKHDLAKIQSRWMRFLSDVEKSCPGITLVARRLPATLTYGLRRLVTADGIPEGFRYTNEGVEALARLLVQRMANHRAALLFSAADGRRQEDKLRIFNKLVEGAADTRSIYHPLHLPADYCRELLHELASENFVERNGRLWSCVEGREVTAGSSHRLQLDV